MSNYTKERNFLFINLDGINGTYRLDLSTLIFYGLRGAPLKNIPHKLEIERTIRYNHGERATNLGTALIDWLNSPHPLTNSRSFLTTIQGAEKLDAAGVPRLYGIDRRGFEWASSHIKEIVALCKNDPTLNRFPDIQSAIDWEETKKALGNNTWQLTPQMYQYIRNYHRGDITSKELDIYNYYLVRGKLWEYDHHDVPKVAIYLQYCEHLHKTPQKVNNFMREYVETYREYELRKTELDNARLVKNYTMQTKAWEFEYGDYTIVIPSCANDIIDEGAKMSHCVGSYVGRVVENSTYIVFVRRKDTPDKCYITCQVSTEGIIGQYYLSHDRCIEKPEDIAFKEAFSDHLKKVWKFY